MGFLEWCLTQSDWCPYKKRRQDTERIPGAQMPRGMTIWKGRHVEAKERGFQRKPSMPTPWSLTSASRTVKKISCCYKPPSLCYFVVASLNKRMQPLRGNRGRKQPIQTLSDLQEAWWSLAPGVPHFPLGDWLYPLSACDLGECDLGFPKRFPQLPNGDTIGETILLQKASNQW